MNLGQLIGTLLYPELRDRAPLRQRVEALPAAPDPSVPAPRRRTGVTRQVLSVLAAAREGLVTKAIREKIAPEIRHGNLAVTLADLFNRGLISRRGDEPPYVWLISEKGRARL